MTKKCRSCLLDKEKTEFRITEGYHKSTCKQCESIQANERYKRNKDAINNRRSLYHHSNKEEISARNRDRYIRERESRVERQRSYRMLSGYCEYKANPARVLAKNAKYRAERIKRTPRWLGEYEVFVTQQIYHKAILVSGATGIKHHVDHVIPLISKIVCGLHVPNNLQVIPAFHNLQKSNTYEVEECN